MNKVLVVLLAGFGLLACKKEGPGGDSQISVMVKHHGTLIPGSTVYIKYGAKEFPGSDLSAYDDHKTTGYTGHDRAHTHFNELNKGDYYLYAVGFDSTIMLPVTGGVGVEISRNGDLVETDVPVTEDH